MDEEQFKRECPNLYNAFQKKLAEERAYPIIEFAGLKWKFFSSLDRIIFCRNFITNPTKFHSGRKSKHLGTFMLNDN